MAHRIMRFIFVIQGVLDNYFFFSYEGIQIPEILVWFEGPIWLYVSFLLGIDGVKGKLWAVICVLFASTFAFPSSCCVP